MNKLTFFLLTILIGSSLHAQAPTMKALVPTEWELMNELTEAETKKFMENHKEIFDYCEKISFSHLEGCCMFHPFWWATSRARYLHRLSARFPVFI